MLTADDSAQGRHSNGLPPVLQGSDPSRRRPRWPAGVGVGPQPQTPLLAHGPFRFRLGTALERASLSGSVETVRKLLQHGATVNVRSGRHGSSLQAACASGRSDLVELLLDHNADVHARGGIFGTALQGASSKGSYQAVKLLLEKGADVNTQGGRYGNALQAALVRLHFVRRKGGKDLPDIYDLWGISEKSHSTEEGPIPTAANVKCRALQALSV